MNGKSWYVFVQAALMLIHELVSWLQNSPETQTSKKRKDVPKS